MSENVLPAVAKSIFTECKKCGAERYHVVVAHTTEKSAKVKCEVCGASKTYRLTAPKAKIVGTGVRKSNTAAGRKNAHIEEYQNLMKQFGDSDTVSYNMKLKFSLNQRLQHPKFGVGFIRAAQSDKIEVVFEDEVRSLVHNRG